MIVYTRIEYYIKGRYFSFFFQAEDGIRDRDVTEVQTCALPIFLRHSTTASRSSSEKPSMLLRASTAASELLLTCRPSRVFRSPTCRPPQPGIIYYLFYI